MSIDWPQVLHYVSRGPSETVHFFKQVFHEDTLCSTISSMANSQGGFVIIGVDLVNYHLVGTNKDIPSVEKLIQRYCHPKIPMGIKLIRRNDKEIMVIQIPVGKDRPYLFNDKCYIREACQTRLATEEEELFFDKNDIPISNSDAVTSITINDPSPVEQAQEALPPTQQGDTQPNLTLIRTASPSEATPIPVSMSDAKEIVEKTAQVIVEEPVEDAIDAKEEEISSPLLAPETEDQEIKSEDVNDTPKDADFVDINDRQTKALRFLKQNNSIKNKDYRRLFSVSHKTAHLELVNLVKRGFIISQGLGRSTCYVMNEEKVKQASLAF